MAFAGKNGFLSINGVSLQLTSFTVRSNNELEDVSNADSGAFVVTVSHISGFEISAEGLWSGHIGLIEGAAYTFVMAASAAGPYITGTATIRDLEVSVDVKDVARFRLTAQSEGEFIAQI